jgi:hypothetical protein
MLNDDATCPRCGGALELSDTQPERGYKSTQRYSTGELRRDVVFGLCRKCELLIENVALMLEDQEATRDGVLEAIAGAQRARAIFDDGRGDSRAAMTELARAFHALRTTKPPGVSPWEPEALLEWVENSGASTYSLACAHFVLSVWNTRDTEDVLGPFNVMRALAGWDREHRAAFVEWARAPWWP